MVLFSVMQHKILISIRKNLYHYWVLFSWFLPDSGVLWVISRKCLGLGVRTRYLASLVHCLGLFLLSTLPPNAPRHVHMLIHIMLKWVHPCICIFVFNIARVLWKVKVNTRLEKIKLFKNSSNKSMILWSISRRVF